MTGALGANIVENLARSGFAKIKVIDRDRIEERNLSTQPYYKSDIGAYKVKILSNSIYRALGTMIEPSQEELTLDNAAKLLQDSQLVIDTFDNSVSRKAVADYCSKTATACLHAGLAGDYSEVIWNDIYTIH
jgi:molybdopterin-synthase adenylyltransferase